LNIIFASFITKKVILFFHFINSAIIARAEILVTKRYDSNANSWVAYLLILEDKS
jgi:Mg2+ and Co2+ transporter CorA